MGRRSAVEAAKAGGGGGAAASSGGWGWSGAASTRALQAAIGLTLVILAQTPTLIRTLPLLPPTAGGQG